LREWAADVAAECFRKCHLDVPAEDEEAVALAAAAAALIVMLE